MNKKYHILNGDSLNEQFPKQIAGEIFIMRECLVDGDVQSNNLEDFFKIRSKFISDSYEGFSENDYYQTSVPEFKKIRSIPNGSEINLWFEDDLFCQVNLWFIINLLNRSDMNYSLNLVRPTPTHEYCFAEMTETDLLAAYINKTHISSSNIKRISKLCHFYQKNDCREMIKIANELNPIYPFIMPACEAHTARFSRNGSYGRPEQSIIRIMDELQTNDFTTIFWEFCKRERIYGFGDLQVKRLYKKIKNT